MSREAVVVGAGVSGAGAALLLAARGFRVTLVERADRALPLLSGFAWNGLDVDTGFHYTGALGPGEPLARLLAHLGVFRRLTPLAMDPEGFDLVRGGPAPFAFPRGYAALRERLAQAFPSEAAAIDAYLNAVRRAYRSFPYLFPDVPWNAGEFSPFGPWGETSLAEFLAPLTRDKRLIDLLSVHRALYGAQPGEIPFGAHGAVMGSYYESAWRIAGGGAAVARAFADELAARGVRVLLGRPARSARLSAAGTLDAIVLEDGEPLSCDVAVLSTHPAEALRIMPRQALRPAYQKRLAGLEDSASALLLFAAVERPSSLLDRANLYLLPEEDGPALASPEEAPARGLVYVTALRRRNAPQTAGGIMALCPAPADAVAPWRGARRADRPEAYRRYKEAALAALADRLRRCAPEAAGPLESYGGATPLTLSDYTGAPTGALYGVKRRVGQLNPLPPTRVPGLFLTGQAVGVPGLLGATVSAFLTVGHIVGHETLLGELRARPMDGAAKWRC